MKPGGRRSNLLYKLFETTVDNTVREEIPGFIGEHKVSLCPLPPGFQTLPVLLQLLKPEQFCHRGSQRQDAGFVVLGLGEVKLTVLVLFPAKLLFYRQRSGVQVQAIPGEAQNLPFPNTCKKRDFIQVFIGVSLDYFQELRDLGSMIITSLSYSSRPANLIAVGTVERASRNVNGFNNVANLDIGLLEALEHLSLKQVTDNLVIFRAILCIVAGDSGIDLPTHRLFSFIVLPLGQACNSIVLAFGKTGKIKFFKLVDAPHW